MRLTKLLMGQIIILAILLGVSLSLYPDIVRVKRNHKTPQPQEPKRVQSPFPKIQKEKNNSPVNNPLPKRRRTMCLKSMAKVGIK